jgi:hypothetical protein
MFQLPADKPVEFRDGPRWLPEYLVTMLSGIDTIRYTYDEAIAMANDAAVGNVLGRHMQRVQREHFAEARDGDR